VHAEQLAYHHSQEEGHNWRQVARGTPALAPGGIYREKDEVAGLRIGEDMTVR
jgi:hypothetical protein